MKINYNYSQTTNYLTEEILGKFLKEFLPETEIIHDKKVPNSNINNRPDFRLDDIKLILEFNGKFHYTNPNTILSDFKKRSTYESMGYTVRTIPYWIQLHEVVIYDLFCNNIKSLDSSKIKNYNLYPLGFIDKNCPLPATFCDLGINETLREYKYWNNIIDCYHKYFDLTLIEKIFEKDSFLKVANLSIMKYFKDFYNNNGQGFEMSFDPNCYPGLKAEMKYLNNL